MDVTALRGATGSERIQRMPSYIFYIGTSVHDRISYYTDGVWNLS